jgi:hypothetical protein
LQHALDFFQVCCIFSIGAQLIDKSTHSSRLSTSCQTSQRCKRPR